MSPSPANAKSIFLTALDVAPDQRSAYVDDACGDDGVLRARVGELLKAHDKLGPLPSRVSAAVVPGIDATVSLRLGQQIGPYRLVEVIGEGGMGVVYLAEEREPIRRQVALKIIKPGTDSRQIIARFEAERQALAMMNHPNIAKVYDAGAIEGTRPYFVMELVRGLPITEYCDQNNLPTRARLELFILICQAVQHAHQKGIIHRDIKPSNILVMPQDGQPIPKIIDFGIAKATRQPFTADTIHTGFGQMIGTPLYMSPEQAEHGSLDIDTRSDIYSLGVLLYELLTGTTPFDKQRLKRAGFDELPRIIREEDPPRPSVRVTTLDAALGSTISRHRGVEQRQLRKVIEGDLDWIVMKALEKDRTRRYETSSAFSMDVERYLRDEPVEAHAPSTHYRLRKFVRRNRTQVVAATAVALALLFTVVFSAILVAVAFRRERALYEQSQRSQQAAERSELQARQMAYASDIMLASRAWRDGDLRQFVDLLQRQRPRSGQLDLRGFEWRYLWHLPHVNSYEIEDQDGAVYFGCVSADGRRFATTSATGTLCIHDLTTFAVCRSIETGQDEVNGAAFAPDGHTLASVGDDGTVKIWDLSDGHEIRTIAAHPGEAYQAVFTPDGQTLATCGDDPVIRLWDPQSGKLLGELVGHERAVEAIAISPDGRILGSASSDRTARLWDIAAQSSSSRTTKITCKILSGHRNRLSSIAFSPDGNYVATGSLDKTACVWETARGARVAVFEHLDAVQCVAFGPEGQWLAAGDRGGAVRIWPRTWSSAWSSADAPWELPETIRWCGISPDGHTVAAATCARVALMDRATRATRELKLDDPTILREFEREGAAASRPTCLLAFSRNGGLLACFTEIHGVDPAAASGWSLRTGWIWTTVKWSVSLSLQTGARWPLAKWIRSFHSGIRTPGSDVPSCGATAQVRFTQSPIRQTEACWPLPALTGR